MNKYLEKISSRADGVINSVIGWGDRIIGHSAGRAAGRLKALRESTHLGAGIPASTMSAAKAEKDALSRASRNTRIVSGATAAGLGTAGFLGIHKYQQHRDNKIMNRILTDAQNNAYKLDQK